MHSPENTAKMIDPVLNIKCQVFEDKKQKPVQKRAKSKIHKMKSIDGNKNNDINSPEKKINNGIKGA
jgi:hypothetical protein